MVDYVGKNFAPFTLAPRRRFARRTAEGGCLYMSYGSASDSRFLARFQRTRNDIK